MKKRKIVDAIDEYYSSLDYRNLSKSAQKDYKYCLDTLLDTPIGTRTVRSMSLTTLTVPQAQRAYNHWAERGLSFADHTCRVSSKLYNFSIQLGYCTVNPFSKVSRRPYKTRKVVWTREDITRFLNVAYSSFNTRSVGLIVQMAYEWCQRLGDMTQLKWDNYDFEHRVLYLEQSKRRAKVELPTTDELHEMLVQQKQEIGFQPYVAPICNASKVTGNTYNKHTISMAARRIMRKAGLSEELQIMDMRRTGTMEMVDAGVPLPQIMAVTGHQSPASVMPYMKHTLTSARKAATLRFTSSRG